MDGDTRWAHNTPDNRSGTLYIVTFLGFTYSNLTFLARLLIKWQMLGLDDFAMLLAQIASIVQFALVLASMSAGLAQSYHFLTDEQYARMTSTYTGAQVTMYVSLGFSKIASVLLVRRLFIRDMKSAWAVCNLTFVSVVIWTAVSTTLVSAGCANDSLSPRSHEEACPGINTRYLFILVTDCVADAALAFIPTYLCWRLQMSVLFKLQVLMVFAARLPLLALAALTYKAWIESLYSDNPGLNRTDALVYQQSQLCLSLLSATIPCLKSFIRSFDTGSGQKAGFGYSSSSGAYGHISRVHHSSACVGDTTESYQMAHLSRGNKGTSAVGQHETTKGAMRVNKKSTMPDGSSTTDEGDVDLERRSTQESDRKSQHSTQELVIRKDVQFHVMCEPAKKGSEKHRPGLLRLPK